MIWTARSDGRDRRQQQLSHHLRANRPARSLPAVFGTVLIPEAVAKEIGFSAPWLEIRAVKDSPLETRFRNQLGAGESAALLLAVEVAPARIVLDDRRARRVAEELGLSMIGTPGILVRAKQRGVLNRVSPVMTAMRKTGFYVSKELVEKTLRLAGEVDET
jgi:predicted nucleic acid-binding protein